MHLKVPGLLSTRINLADARPQQVAEMGVHDDGTSPLPFERGATGAQVPLHNSIISTFMIYQDRIETNFLWFLL